MDVDISAPFCMAVEVARRVEEFPVIVAPPVWSGFTHYNMGFPGTINLRLETFQSLLADIFRSIHANGFKRIISLNGHGGNAGPCRAVHCRTDPHPEFPAMPCNAAHKRAKPHRDSPHHAKP